MKRWLYVFSQAKKQRFCLNKNKTETEKCVCPPRKTGFTRFRKQKSSVQRFC